MEIEANHAMNYVVTAHKPTAVIKSVVGNFTGPSDLNLIVAKATRLEVHTSTPQGLEAVLDVPIYGRISNIELFRPKALKYDLLFLLLEKYKYSILKFNAVTREVDTVVQGDVRDTVGRNADNGQIAVIDPECRIIGLQLYDGMFKVIQLDDHGQLRDKQPPFNTRLDELAVLDIAMLPGCPRPTLAVLYQDSKSARHLKAYEVALKEKDLVELNGSYTQHNLDPGASLLIPVPLPLGGVVVLGQESIVYFGPKGVQPQTVPLRPCVLKAWGKIDVDRILLSDNLGLLYVLVLQNQDGKVTRLKLEILGRTSSASSLSYLDDGVVFVGSRQGDSQLVRLSAEPPDPAAPKSYLQVMETWPNLGPIVDFSVMDLDRQGQGQLVCCSGAMSDGSLRVVRNGVGINEQASIELTGIRGLWSLRSSWSDSIHKYLVLSFVGETRILAMSQEEELDEAELAGFESSALTLWCGNSASDHIVQVTPSGVRAVAGDSGMLESQWQPQAGAQLSVAAGNGTQVVVASGGGHLQLLEVTQQGITEQASVNVGGEVACVDVTPTGSDPLRCHYIAVGTWDMAVQLYAIRGGGGGGACQLELMTTQQLGVEVIPRSVMMWCFEDVPYLLVGLGDGQLHYWRMHSTTGALHDKKKLVLGSKPVLLRPFKGLAAAKGQVGGADGAANGARGGVFAASDRPAVLYSSHKKILFANLNESEVTYMAPFNCVSFPDSLAIAKENSLTIGTVDQIQKLHIHTLPLHEQPRRICYQEDTHTLGVLTITNMGMEDEVNYLRVYDAHGGYELKASYELEPGELGCSITSCKLGDADNTPYFVIGTALAVPDEPEPTKGRLLVLQYAQGKVTLVAKRDIKGAAYEVLPFQGGRLLSSCNNKVQVHKWFQREDGSKELQLECSASGHIIALSLAARGDHVLMGDLNRSMSLMLYKPQEGQLELRAQDYASNWCTAVAMLDDDTYLAAENSHNLVVVRKNTDATTDEDRGRLELVGEFHLGEFVNRVRAGSLVLRLPDSELAQVPTWLFGTVDGTIGVLASLPPPLFDFLTRLQDALRKVVVGVGGLSHQEWRAFENERKTGGCKGFVDGDLIELFLDLKPEDAQRVVTHLGGDTTVEEVTHKVEELARLH